MSVSVKKKYRFTNIIELFILSNRTSALVEFWLSIRGLSVVEIGVLEKYQFPRKRSEEFINEVTVEKFELILRDNILIEETTNNNSQNWLYT